MDAMEQPVIGKSDQGVLTLTLNRAGQFNALSEEVLAALQDALDRAASDETLRCVVLAASGRAFCAGHDLKQMQANRDHDYYLRLFGQCGKLMQSIVDFPVPVIAKVHGTATAAGCQLVASCDLAVAADTAKFAVSGINVGLFCSTPAVALSRNVAAKKAFEMLITGEFISADDALQHGLVNRVVPAAELDSAVEGLVATIAAKSPVAVRTGKAMFHRQRGMALGAAYDYAAEVMAENMMADDVFEGIDAFINKRHPVWKGR
ncbi:MAG: enoyl-CoA hydratase [Burkholderiaceae bacterium]